VTRKRKMDTGLLIGSVVMVLATLVVDRLAVHAGFIWSGDDNFHRCKGTP